MRVFTDIYRCWHQWIVLFLLLLTWWEVEDRDWVWWRVIKSYAHKKVDVFLWPTLLNGFALLWFEPQYISIYFKKFCGTFEQNVVVLYPSAQRSRVLHLLDIDNNNHNNNNRRRSAIAIAKTMHNHKIITTKYKSRWLNFIPAPRPGQAIEFAPAKTHEQL